MKVALCAIAKTENRYIREFVEHYQRIGFDKLFLCDNNEPDGERFDEVLKGEMESGFVQVVDCRGLQRYQKDAYDKVYHEYGSGFDWMAFFDVDEYLTFAAETGYATIKDFLECPVYDKFDAVTVNWMCYGDNEKLHYEDRPLKERFPNPLPLDYIGLADMPVNSYVKTILRTGREFYFTNPHCPAIRKGANLRIGSVVGGEHESEESFEKMDFSIAYLRHHTTKTIEEYLDNMTRGSAFSGGKGEGFLRASLENKFFVFNRRTVSKVEMIHARFPGIKLRDSSFLRIALQWKARVLLSLTLWGRKMKLVAYSREA